MMKIHCQLLVALTVFLAVASARVALYQEKMADYARGFCPHGKRFVSMIRWDLNMNLVYCEPDCNVDNGGCKDNEVCSLGRNTSCSKRDLVCPDVVVCTKRPNHYQGDESSVMAASAARCNPGFFYEDRYLEGLPPRCVPYCDADNTWCEENEYCHVQEANCITAPCDPIITCVGLPTEPYTCTSGWIYDVAPRIECNVVVRLSCEVPPCPFYLICDHADGCWNTRCVLNPRCKNGEKLETLEGRCCPQCVQDCSMIQCYPPNCKYGEKLETREGRCCPHCVQDCLMIQCYPPKCKRGERLETAEGACCPDCVPDIYNSVLPARNQNNQEVMDEVEALD